ncbi:unnamed protein product [Menidia menidia]|uniref:Transmembrane protein 254 n=1 Tax=Menidia menidia TaxID=238744 RepID=A0A8S4BRF5_9TELE|nr:unnamed protein product [Menidia menidia]
MITCDPLKDPSGPEQSSGVGCCFTLRMDGQRSTLTPTASPTPLPHIITYSVLRVARFRWITASLTRLRFVVHADASVTLHGHSLNAESSLPERNLWENLMNQCISPYRLKPPRCGLFHAGCIVFSPEKIPFEFLGGFGTFCQYLVDNHAGLMHKGDKGIDNTGTRCLWFLQTFLFGITSLGLLLKYDPKRPKQH